MHQRTSLDMPFGLKLSQQQAAARLVASSSFSSSVMAMLRRSRALHEVRKEQDTPTGRWWRLTSNVIWTSRREDNKLWLRDLQMAEVDAKLPEMTEEQLRCWHPPEGRLMQANQWSSMSHCGLCYVRLTYVPSTKAVEHAAQKRHRAKEKKKRQPVTRAQARQKTGLLGEVPESRSDRARLEEMLMENMRMQQEGQRVIAGLAEAVQQQGMVTHVLTQQLQAMTLGPMATSSMQPMVVTAIQATGSAEAEHKSPTSSGAWSDFGVD